MPWLQIREATEADRARLELAAVRFIKSHGLENLTDYASRSHDFKFSPVAALERALNRWGYLYQTDPVLHDKLSELWRAEAAQALREEDASGIVGGYVVGWRND